MAQHDYDINSTDSISGFQFRQDTNSALSAIKSTNSGIVAPTSPVAGMLWLDTSITPNILKIRDTTNTSWLDIYLEAKMGTTIASAATTIIGTFGSGEIVHISGTTTISSLGSSRIGTRRVLIFDAVTTLVHNASAIICPGASNITTIVGMVVSVICEGGSPSVWRVIDILHPSVDSTELGYLNGVTSNLQTQLDSKANSNTPTLIGVKSNKVAIAANNIDLSLANLYTKTITTTTTFTVSNIATTGTINSFILELTNGGAYTINWWAGIKWANGIPPILTLSGIDILAFYTHDGGTTWRGLVLAKDSR